MARFIRSTALLVAALLVLTGVGACAADAARSKAETLADEYGLHIAGEPSVTEVALPEDLVTPPWGSIETAVNSAGYDLEPYGGSTLTLSSYPLQETREGLSLTLHVLEDGERVVGAYATVTADNPVYQPIPGVVSLNELTAE